MPKCFSTYREMLEVTDPDVIEWYNSDKLFESPKEYDSDDLHDVIAGSVVLAAEPVDYPFTDGIIVYVRKPDRTISAVIIVINDDDEDWPVLQIKETVCPVREVVQ